MSHKCTRTDNVAPTGSDAVVDDPLPFLAKAGVRLAGSLDYEQTLRCLLDLIVPTLADMCSVHLLELDGRFRRIAARRDTETETATLSVSLSDHYLDDGQPHGPIHDLLARGESLLSAPVEDADIDVIVGAQRRVEIVQRLGVTSAMVVPLVANGQPFGVIALSRIEPRPMLNRQHLHLVEELARRAALALHSAGLYRAVRESQLAAEGARQRIAFLAEASTALAASLDVRTTLQTVLSLAIPLLADSCSVALVEDDSTVRRVAVAHTDPAMQRLANEQFAVIPFADNPNHPIAIVLRTGQPVVDDAVSDETRRCYASGDYLGFLRRLRTRARVVVPLEARGRRFGALTLATSDPARTFGEDDVALGVELAGRAALAIDNARLYRDARDARDHLEQQLELSDAIVRNIAEGFLVVDERGRISYANPVAEQLLGRPSDTLLGCVAHDSMHVADQHGTPLIPQDCRIKDVIRLGKTIRLDEEWFIRADGTTFPVTVTTSPLIRRGQVVGAATVFRDATERKLAEQERIRLLAEREAEAEELRAVTGRLERGLAALLGPHEVSQLITSDFDQDAIVRQLLEVAVRTANLRAATLRHRDGKGRLRIWQRVGDDAIIQAAAGGATGTLVRASTMSTRRPSQYQSRGLGPNEAELTGWCVPLIVKDRVIGVLEAFGEARPSDELTCEILGSIALQAATAIENARLYREVAQRERALRRLVQQLMAAQEDERRRLAYEIHDGFAQLASGVQQLLEAYAHDVPAESVVARKRMDVLLSLAGRTVEEIRRVLAGLRPTVLDDFGLASGLRAYADGLAAEGQRIRFTETLGSVRLPSHVEITLFRLAQEALSNVKRHADVEQADLRLIETNEHIVLEVQDNGRGFDLASVKHRDRPGERMGLLSMQERIAQIGGGLEIISRNGAGTLVRATVPVRQVRKRSRARRGDP